MFKFLENYWGILWQGLEFSENYKGISWQGREFPENYKGARRQGPKFLEKYRVPYGKGANSWRITAGPMAGARIP